MKIRPGGAQLLNANRQDEANTRFFANSAEVPQKRKVM